MIQSVAALARLVGGEVQGDGSASIERVAALEDAGPREISFFSNRKYRKAFETSRAGAVIVEPAEDVPPGRTVIRVKNAYLAFAKVVVFFNPRSSPAPGVSDRAFVDPTAQVDPSCEVMPLVFIGPGAVVGKRCILHPGAYVGAGAQIGDDCLLWPNAVVRDRCRLGNRVVLEPGCVVGADGFGFAFDPDGENGSGPRHFKIPQIGIAEIEDDVELGANTCVDRAALGKTVVGRGCIVDNLVQIAHNVQVGPLSILVSQVGISGSTRLGRSVVAAGQVGIVGHVNIGDGATLLAQCGVMGDVEAGATIVGSPARPRGEYMREEVASRKLPELLKRVRELEKRLGSLEGK